MLYSNTYVKQSLSKRPKIGFQDQLSLNAGQKYCRMLQGEHSAILSTFIKLQFVIKIFVKSIFECFTVSTIDINMLIVDTKQYPNPNLTITLFLYSASMYCKFKHIHPMNTINSGSQILKSKA